jgi:hypothetical protein
MGTPQRNFATPDFSQMLMQRNAQLFTQGVQVAQVNPADFGKRYMDFLEMDAEDKQDYIEALQQEAQIDGSSMDYFCFLMSQQGQICPRDAEAAAKKKRQKNTIIFVVILLVIVGVGGYFLFKK